jgi:hypothetical protein
LELGVFFRLRGIRRTGHYRTLLYHLPTKHSTMAAVVSASRVVAGASSSVALSRGRAQLKAVKMGKAQARGSMVVLAVRKSRVVHPRAA